MLGQYASSVAPVQHQKLSANKVALLSSQGQMTSGLRQGPEPLQAFQLHSMQAAACIMRCMRRCSGTLKRDCVAGRLPGPLRHTGAPGRNCGAGCTPTAGWWPAPSRLCSRSYERARRTCATMRGRARWVPLQFSSARQWEQLMPRLGHYRTASHRKLATQVNHVCRWRE